MPFTEFYCRPSDGSNLNAGSEDAAAARLTYASGSWVQSTGVFTVASGDPVADGVVVGDFASVYADGSTVTGFVGRVTARTTTTITVSSSGASGTTPTDGTNNRTLKIGGAWKGPNGSEGFPFGFAASAMVAAAVGNRLRVNFKNNASYSITASLVDTLGGQRVFQGYSSTPNDGGRFTIDGGATGASYILLNVGNSSIGSLVLADAILQNNGDSGSAAGLQMAFLGHGGQCLRVTVKNVRGDGFVAASGGCHFEMCDAKNCNQSNTAGLAGFRFSSGQGACVRCVSHRHTGSNGNGFVGNASNGDFRWSNCLAVLNGGAGFAINCQNETAHVCRCDAFDNDGDGLSLSSSSTYGRAIVESSNFVKNGLAGIRFSTNNNQLITLLNNGFGGGGYANTSGALVNDSTNAVTESGRVNYTSHPYIDPDNGDFRIASAEAKGLGAGLFVDADSDFLNLAGYPDIGSLQHQDAGGGILRHPGMSGGLSA